MLQGRTKGPISRVIGGGRGIGISWWLPSEVDSSREVDLGVEVSEPWWKVSGMSQSGGRYIKTEKETLNRAVKHVCNKVNQQEEQPCHSVPRIINPKSHKETNCKNWMTKIKNQNPKHVEIESALKEITRKCKPFNPQVKSQLFWQV